MNSNYPEGHHAEVERVLKAALGYYYGDDTASMSAMLTGLLAFIVMVSNGGDLLAMRVSIDEALDIWEERVGPEIVAYVQTYYAEQLRRAEAEQSAAKTTTTKPETIH